MQNGVVWWSNANCIWWFPCAPVVLVQHPWELLLPFVSLSLCLCLYSTWLEFLHPIPVLYTLEGWVLFVLFTRSDGLGWIGQWVRQRFSQVLPPFSVQHCYTCVSVFCVGFEDNVHCLWNFLLCEIFMHYCCIVVLAVQNLLSVFKSSTAVNCVTWREMMWCWENLKKDTLVWKHNCCLMAC